MVLSCNPPQILNRKDTRNATAGINIEIIPAVPPIMEIECADPMLCLVGEGGKLFINPSSRQEATTHFSTYPSLAGWL